MLTDIFNHQYTMSAINFINSYLNIKDFHEQYNIYLTDKMFEDYEELNGKSNNLILNAAGCVILPNRETEKITILISTIEFKPWVIVHELSHAFDFITFSQYYCNGNICQIKEHRLFYTFRLWSEFHAKTIEIPYTQILLAGDSSNPYKEFKEDVDRFFYPKYTEKLLAKSNLTMIDIMYYFGEIQTCNIICQTDKYKILDKFNDFYSTLFDYLCDSLTFQGFVDNSTSLYTLLNQEDY